MNLLWFGPLTKDEDLFKNNVQSPASNVWQKQQLKLLSPFYKNISVYSYVPYRSFPYGNFLILNEESFFIKPNINIIQNNYINLKKAKEIFISFSIIFRLILNRELKKNKIAIFYNSSLENVIIARFLKRFSSIKCIEIIADNLDNDIFDAHIYLSYGYYNNSKYRFKHFFDQPTKVMKKNVIINNKKNTKKIITYAGALSKYGGIVKFAKIFVEICSKNIFIKNNLQLNILGHGDIDKNLINLSDNYSEMVKFYGFLKQTEMEIILENSDFFINPRPLLSENQKNFPSKLITYLEYGKPILSTHTEGISPEYDNILYFYDYASIVSLEKKLIFLLNLDENDLNILIKKLENFSIENVGEKKIIELNKFIQSVIK